MQKRFNIFIGAMILILLFLYFMSFDNEILWGLVGFVWLIFCFAFLGLKFTSFVRKEPLLGRFDGEIIFKKDLISIKGEEISLDEITKIEIYNDDYKGGFVPKGRYNVEGCVSQGVSNTLIIKDKNNKETKIHFLLERKNQLREMENLLIYYYQKGIIHRLHFMDILGLGYDEIQEYKHKYGI